MIQCISQVLTSFQAALPEYFVESWTYSSALSVVEQCDNWTDGLKLEGSAQAAVHASKGELLELARNQVSSPQQFHVI
jgi:trafficking protein particle complex subunit 10